MKIKFRNLRFIMEESGEQLIFLPGDRIIIQGRSNDAFYYVKSGFVEVYQEGKEKTPLACIARDQYFGEITCLTGRESNATYVAAERAALIKTDREGLLRLMADLPEFNRHVVETLCGIIKAEGSLQLYPGASGGLPGDQGQVEENQGRSRRPRVGLALGAGFVRGMAHVGVIRSFEKNNIHIDMVSGTSAGALVGACLAAGVSVEEMETLAVSLRWSRVAAPVIPPGKAFLNNEKLGHLLDGVIGGKHFDQLNIPLAVVAADACSGEEVIIREGRVSEAVRASTAMPAVFEPVRLFNRTLVDGGGR